MCASSEDGSIRSAVRDCHMYLADIVNIRHHGGKDTVTGSCHELAIGADSIIIDCGLFQGADAQQNALAIEFSLTSVRALVLTHAHIDHLGRLPWLIAAGFRGPIYCTEATAHLVPLMLEDGLKLQLGLNAGQRARILELIHRHIRPVKYGVWIPVKNQSAPFTYLRFNPAGHILGSAYIEVKLPNEEVAVFSGDLGPSNTPLLPDPTPPPRVDYLFIESTYGDKCHDSMKDRSERLLTLLERSLKDGGAIIIPAFSVGRTQELLYDIEALLHEHKLSDRLPIIVDSPLAAKVTKSYRRYRKLWAQEAADKLSQGRQPLNFQQCVVVDGFREHRKLVNRLASTGEPAVVVAASGMCQGGRIMEYLKALLPDKRTDIVFTGYQAEGTLGREIQEGGTTVWVDGEAVNVAAQVHTMSGYSAHADQGDLMKFLMGCKVHLKQLHLIHGEAAAKRSFAIKLKNRIPEARIIE